MIGTAKAQSPESVPLPIEGDLPRATATEWLNSKPLTAADLSGKVALIDFWTYSCVNWRRSLPYVRAWAEKYKDRGLVVIGVHAPEFDFEKHVDNVRWAVKEMKIDYRVLISGKPPGVAHGVDADEKGNGTVTEQRLYQLIRQPKPIGDRQFTIEFLDSGVEVFSFTFG